MEFKIKEKRCEKKNISGLDGYLIMLGNFLCFVMFIYYLLYFIIIIMQPKYIIHFLFKGLVHTAKECGCQSCILSP